uniref:Pre-mRNA-splicing factor 38 n=1 Tax=Phallusia mammillata TaxID=59560 RepID=A0A6F9DQB7_9ASCI|nr:pre-mRNA-splicing factor 38B [Phallusia mammillata]
MAEQYEYGDEEDQQEDYGAPVKKLGNNLPVWGNPRTMNLNHLVLTNIQNSPYFKVRLIELKTYHEVIDEIYYKVDHLEPWERGTRKTAGQTGMCGGVRGVGAGGVVSTSFCILFKLFTLKLTRKQLNGMLNHTDSPFIRGLGIMYIRFSQAPADLWDWFEPYLEDEEEIDVKAGGGCVMTIGMMIRTVLTKLEWFSTLFPRIPVPIQKMIEENLTHKGMTGRRMGEAVDDYNDDQHGSVDRDRRDASRHNSRERSHNASSKHRSLEPERRRNSRSRDERRSHTHERRRTERSRSRDRSSRKRSRSRDRDTRKRSSYDRDSRKRRSRSRERKRRSRSRSRDRRHRR